MAVLTPETVMDAELAQGVVLLLAQLLVKVYRQLVVLTVPAFVAMVLVGQA